ncbi:MAG: FdhF/YdeP family oxidoreductase [Phycisphaerae bacterium]
MNAGGGWAAVRYALKKARESGNVVGFMKALSSRNTCKTCALGMGGQAGGMVDESNHFPEVCKKSMQAMAADMQPAIPNRLFNEQSIARLGRMTPYELEHQGRLAQPLLAEPGASHYRPIAWEEALQRSTEALRSVQPDESFFYSSGRSSNEAAFILQLFARLYGTNNINNCSYYCHQASGVGLQSALGTGTATVTLDDVDRCDLIMLIGGNPASNHPRLMRRLVELRRRGGEVIVINPMVELGLTRFSIPSDAKSLMFGSDVASCYVQPHIGGDIALLTGMQKHLLERELFHTKFMESYTDDAPRFVEHVRATAWNQIVEGSGVSEEVIRHVADRYAKSNAAIFAWTMGITHHKHGTDNVRAIVNTALCRGMIGREGAGLLPIRGHSNVQGIGSVGVTPTLKKVVFERLESEFNVSLPTTKGMDTLACMEAMADGRLKSGWCLGGNLYGANPDLTFAGNAMAKMDHLTYFSTTLNSGHFLGRARETVILPVLARDEEPSPTTQESMFNFVRMSDGGPARHQGPRSEVEIVATLAQAVLGDDGPIDWQSMKDTRSIRQAIGAVVPGYEKIKRMDDTRHEFQIDGRTFHEPTFPTESGKAKFHVTPIPQLVGSGDELRLMTIRSEGQFNTVVYEESDIYRYQERRDVILMNADDMRARGIRPDQSVTVTSDTGVMHKIIARAYEIPPGNAAMYYPEANVLVGRQADPESRTPAFKAVPVTVSTNGHR